jgi:hypothetical protein
LTIHDLFIHRLASRTAAVDTDPRDVAAADTNSAESSQVLFIEGDHVIQ